MKKKALVTIAAIAVCLIGAWQLIGMHDGNNPARDLQEEEATGGMTVTLQISVADIVRSKAANPQDAKLNEALAYASENPENDFVGVFCKKCAGRQPCAEIQPRGRRQCQRRQFHSRRHFARENAQRHFQIRRPPPRTLQPFWHASSQH